MNDSLIIIDYTLISFVNLIALTCHLRGDVVGRPRIQLIVNELFRF